jgi:hypothetical protein
VTRLRNELRASPPIWAGTASATLGQEPAQIGLICARPPS